MKKKQLTEKSSDTSEIFAYALNHGLSMNIDGKQYEIHNDRGSHKGKLTDKDIKERIDNLLNAPIMNTDIKIIEHKKPTLWDTITKPATLKKSKKNT